MTLLIRCIFLFFYLTSLPSIYCVESNDAKKVDKEKNGNENLELNVHLVPHTHDDVGWLKTVDQYFYGLNNTIQHACVKSILDSAIRALLENPERKFTYVEMAFFHKWWVLQTPEMQSKVRNLVKQKQLTFVNGGWCMHDEATTHFMGMIDQTTRGHDFLKTNFDGYTPRIGWQLDPFGHSATQASLMSAEVGFDALFFGRIDYEDLQLRQDSSQCEGVWKPSDDENLGVDGQIFWGLSGSYKGNYQPPKGFDLDGYLSDEPLVDGINIEDRVFDFVDECVKQAENTIGNNIMLTMGSDFQYENALENFDRLDTLIYFVNQFQKLGKIPDDRLGKFSSINVFYSNPEIYVDAKSKENIEWKVKKDDFFPYADCKNCFWTGYFTSRPLLKRYERIASSFLHAARQIEAYSSLISRTKANTESSGLDNLEDAISILQHHDGVSGTSKQHVASDYAFRVSQGMEIATEYVEHLVSDLLETNLTLSYCQKLNISSCDVTQEASQKLGTDIYVVAYNALSKSRREIVSIPVSTDATFEVFNVKDEKIMDSTLLPVTTKIQNEGENIASSFVLYFDTGVLPPVGAVPFRIRMISLDPSSPSPTVMKNSENCRKSELRSGNKDTSMQKMNFSNGNLKVIFENGELKEVHKIDESGRYHAQSLDIQWGYYESFNSKEVQHLSPSQQTHLQHIKPPFAPRNDVGSSYNSDKQNSGAYIFRPTIDNKFHFISQTENIDSKCVNELETTSSNTVKSYKTKLVTEVHSEVSSWIKQIIRMKKGAPYIEVEYQVGPIPNDDNIGKEIVVKYTSSDVLNKLENDESNTVFFTDSNGREFMKRILNTRESWDYGSTDRTRISSQPVSGNYYPVNAAIYIESNKSNETADKAHFSDLLHPRRSSMCVLTDRTQGGSSLSAGSIELMVHRRIFGDDARGVGEPLNETTGGMDAYPPYGRAERSGEGIEVIGTHRVLIGSSRASNIGASMARKEMDNMFSPVYLFMGSEKVETMTSSDIKFTDKSSSDDLDLPFYNPWFSALSSDLPSNSMLITFKKLPGDSLIYLVRIGHQFAANESPMYEKLSEPISIDMKTLFPEGINIKKMVERTLSNNKDRAQWEATRINWNTEQEGKTMENNTKCFTGVNGETIFTVTPMKICTFEVLIEKESHNDLEFIDVKF